MKATVTTPFDGVPDGEVKPRRFEADDEVTGDLAAVAVREGWAVAADEKAEAAAAPAARPAKRRRKG